MAADARRRIQEYLAENPHAGVDEVQRATGLRRATVRRTLKGMDHAPIAPAAPAPGRPDDDPAFN